MVDALSNLYLTSTQAARKARRKERRKAAARAEIEEGTTDKPICGKKDNPGGKVSNRDSRNLLAMNMLHQDHYPM